jgi:hypothetical protein
MVEYYKRRVAATTGKKPEEVARQYTEATVPTPFISLLFDYAGYDPARFSTFVHRGIVVNEEEGTALSVQEPRPENFTVQADMWCGDDWQCAQNLVTQLKLQFNADDTKVLVRFGDARFYNPPYDVPKHCQYMGDIGCRLTDEGITDNSVTTGSPATGKSVRKTFSGTLYGWLPRVPFQVKLVDRFEYTIEDDTKSTPVVLETSTVNFVI